MKAKALLALVLISTGATAQTAYGFAGLGWGMNLTAVVARLKSAGINTSIRSNIICRVSSECWLEFDDGDTTPPKTVEGRAHFKSGVLVEVSIDPAPYLASEREAKLRQAYGGPTSVDNSECALGRHHCNKLFWKAPAGDTIQFNDGGSIRYASGALNREEASDREKNQKRVQF